MSFRFENPMDRVVTFLAKIVLGPSDSQIRFCPIEFCHIGLHENTDPFRKNLKFGIGSHENQPYFDVTMWWYRVDVVPILWTCPVPGYVLPKCPVPVSMLYRYLYQIRYRRPYRYRRYRYWCTEPTELSGTGIDVVPNFPKGPVPVLMTYRTYRRVRYWYCLLYTSDAADE